MTSPDYTYSTFKGKKKRMIREEGELGKDGT